MNKKLFFLFLISLLFLPFIHANGIYVGKTINNYNGNITNGTLSGYVAANTICSLEYSSSHLCSVEEILYTIATTNTSNFSGTGWIQGGPPGFTSSSNDCRGMRYSISTYLGRFWNWDENPSSGSVGWLTNCAQLKPLYCCTFISVSTPSGGGGMTVIVPPKNETIDNSRLVRDINGFFKEYGSRIVPSDPNSGIVILLILILLILSIKEIYFFFKM